MKLLEVIPAHARRWFLLTLLLVMETEFILFNHYQEKMTIRPLVQFPIYRWFLVFFFLVIAESLFTKGKSFERLPNYKVSLRWLGLHAIFAIALNAGITPLWKFTQKFPQWLWLWAPAMSIYAGTWLSALVPPRYWRKTLIREIGWLIPLVAGSGIIVWAGIATVQLWKHLATATLWSATLLLDLVLNDLVVYPDYYAIGTSTFQITIGAPCSGSEGIGLLAGYMLCYLAFRRKELLFPDAFWILPIASLAIWTANVFRVAALVLVGAFLSPDIATKAFHSQAGWIGFSIVGISLTAAIEKYGWFRRESVSDENLENPAAPFLLPLAALLFTRMLSQALTADFDLYYPIRTLVVALVLAFFWKHYNFGSKWLALKPVGLGLFVYLVWIILVPAKDGVPSPWEQLSPWPAMFWVLLRILGAVIVIPLVEELAFRGYLARRLQSKEFERVSVGQTKLLPTVASAICFGFIHQEFLAGTLAGLCFAYALRGQDRLNHAIIAHGVANFCLAIHVMLLNRWSLWN